MFEPLRRFEPLEVKPLRGSSSKRFEPGGFSFKLEPSKSHCKKTVLKQKVANLKLEPSKVKIT
jgi:hypothetical protein